MNARPGQYRNLSHCIVGLAKEAGPRGFYKGYVRLCVVLDQVIQHELFLYFSDLSQMSFVLGLLTCWCLCSMSKSFVLWQSRSNPNESFIWWQEQQGAFAFLSLPQVVCYFLT